MEGMIEKMKRSDGGKAKMKVCIPSMGNKGLEELLIILSLNAMSVRT